MWFALGEDRPVFAFAGLWTPRRRVHGPKSALVEGDHELNGFLTMEANAVVAPIRAKAMPVILTTPEQGWKSDAPAVLAPRKPLPDHALHIVARARRRMLPSL